MNNYEMTIERGELLGILSNYYSKMYNQKVTVKDKIEKIYTGYYDEEMTVVKLYYELTIELLGHKATKKVDIKDEEIKDILNGLIDENYEVVYLIRSIDNKTTGYFKNENTVSTFTGIKLSIREKQNRLILK